MGGRVSTVSLSKLLAVEIQAVREHSSDATSQ